MIASYGMYIQFLLNSKYIMEKQRKYKVKYMKTKLIFPVHKFYTHDQLYVRKMSTIDEEI